MEIIDDSKKWNEGTSDVLSRRQILVGAASAALAAAAPSALAVSTKAAKHKRREFAGESLSPEHPIRRYMAASVCLQDGRILVTGGFNRPATEDSQPLAMDSAMILDPNTGACLEAAPMSIPRARHAAVLLRNGLVVVIGGISRAPTASVEVYDPQLNEWRLAAPLDQPRYDHSVACDGANIFILGGSSQSMISSVELIRLEAVSSSQPV
jgi:hypothetical protein